MFLFTPAESTASYTAYVEEQLQAPQVNWGCKTLDNSITPMKPGQVTMVVARPGNGKTSFMVYLARKTALDLRARGEDKDKCVVYISWEEPVESIEMSIQSGERYSSEDVAWNRVNLDQVVGASLSRPSLPIWLIGRSLVRDRDKRKPPLTVDKVIDTIKAMFYEFGKKPVLICGDYLQKVPVSVRGRSRMDEVTEAMFSLTELSIDTNCPVLFGAQATRDVDDQGLPIPTLSGAQWTSAIEQEAFRMLALLRPTTVFKKGGGGMEYIEVGGREYKVDENLLLVRLLKQRQYFPSNNTYAVRFDPRRFEMQDFSYVGVGNEI